MFHQNPLKRQFPVGLFAVLLLLVACVYYAANSPATDPSHGSAQLKAEPLLFNGIYQDDPQQIRQAVALYGTLPEELADIAMNTAASEQHPRAVAELLKYVGPNSRTLSGRTALITAAEIPGNAAMVKQLLDAGADPASITCDGHTAIDEARAVGDQPAVELLAAALAARHSR